MRNDPATDQRDHGRPADARMTALYDCHARPLRGLLLQLTLGQRQLADDLVEQTMSRAWRHRDQLPDDVMAVRTWLFTVARRIAIDAVRSRASGQTDHPGLARLSPDHRRVLFEIYVNGRRCREVAQILGISEDAVKSLAYRALRALRTAMDS